MICMALLSAARTTGSSRRPIMPVIKPAGSLMVSLSGLIIRPVSINAQVEALTNSDLLSPRCCCQLPLESLSAIKASMVALSGIRSSDSARHISTMPSCDDRSYSCRNACRPPASRLLSLTAVTRLAAVACIRSDSALLTRAYSSSSRTQSGSSIRKYWLISDNAVTGLFKSGPNAIWID